MAYRPTVTAAVDGSTLVYPSDRGAAWLAPWSRPADMLVVVGVLFAVVWAHSAVMLPHGLAEFLAWHVSVKNALFVALFVTWMPTALTISGSYDARRATHKHSLLVGTLAGCALGGAPAVLLPLVGRSDLSATQVLLTWMGTTAGVILVRAATRMTVPLRRGRTVRVVIAGTGPRARALWAQLRHDTNTAYRLVAVTDVPDALAEGGPAEVPCVAVDQFAEFLMHTVVDEVFVALPVRSCYEEIEAVLQTCEHAGVHAHVLADLRPASIARQLPGTSGGFATIDMHVVHDDWRLAVKRLVDVVAAGAGLVVLAPLLLVLGAAVKLTSPGPALFAQERFGYRKRRFRMYKFRTMVPDAERLLAHVEQLNEASGAAFKIRNDPRVTPLGRFLRRTSLDELPQLWNVLVGHMSLVGPRPMSVRDVSHFDEAWLMRRFSVRPGLTCLWQVGGRSSVTFEEWMRLDLAYIDGWSLQLDAKILARTLPAVFRGVGAV